MTISLDISPELRDYANTVREWSASAVRSHARQADTDHAPPARWRDIVATCPVSLGKGDPRSDIERPRFRDGYWVRQLAITEAISFGDIWLSSALGAGIGHLVVRAMGTPDQVDRWYTPIAEGSGVTAFGLTEPHFGSDTSMVATTATRDGETWVLSGTKMYCTYGAVADYVVVFATTDASLGPAAIKAFVVEPGTAGFRVGKENESKLGIRSWVTSELVFDECVIPVENQLGWTGDVSIDGGAGGGTTKSGRGGALGALAANKPNISATGIGLSEAALDVTEPLLLAGRASYSTARWSQIETELQLMHAAIDRARRLGYRAQWLQDTNRNHKTEASMSKMYGPPTSERIIKRCMQLLGSDGTSTDLLLEKWYRDVKILDIFEGSGQVQRVIVSRALMGRDAGRG